MNKIPGILLFAFSLAGCNEDWVSVNQQPPADVAVIEQGSSIHTQPTNAEVVNILPYPIHQYALDNGLNVVTVPFDSPGIAAFYTVVRVGSRDEIEEGVTGFAHFFEHMMFRGTDNYPTEKYQQVLKSTGASANANTSADRTVYHMTGNVQRLDLMFEVEADRFMNLNYSEHGFKTEAGAVKGEYTKKVAPVKELNRKLRNSGPRNR